MPTATGVGFFTPEPSQTNNPPLRPFGLPHPFRINNARDSLYVFLTLR